MKDRFGLNITTSSIKAAEFYVQGIDIAIAANANAEHFFDKSIEQDAEFALPYSALATLHAMWGRYDLKVICQKNAIKFSKNATQREKNHIIIIDEILNNNTVIAYNLLKKHLIDYPNDAFILSQITGAYSILAFSGNINFEYERLFILENCKKYYQSDWWFDAMYAYSLTETNKHDEARILAEKSLQSHFHSGHTAHTYSHILYETQKWSEAEVFLQKWFIGYDETSPIAGHLRWHQALVEAAQNRPQKAMEIYFSKIRPSICTSPDYGKGIDAASLLWRLSLKNNAIEKHLWQEILAFFKINFKSFGDPFLDIHKSITYRASNNKIDIITFENDLNAFYSINKNKNYDLVLKIDQLIQLQMEQKNEDKKVISDAILSNLPLLGGSHAQRDFIIETANIIK